MEIEGYGIGKEEDIIALEKQCNISLPEDYKEFLRNCNGGTPKVKENHIKFNGIKDKIKVTHFLGVTDGGKVVSYLYSLPKFFERYRACYLDYMLPIAYTYGGNVDLIYYKDEEKEGYYVFDGNLFYKESSAKQYMYKIADTFQELLDHIVEA